uniref:Uncharacterized protein n=1 Tax=Rhizophora mucronata TaxID=61149 RepID=A0A2P2MNY6_RHIMU
MWIVLQRIKALCC